MQSLASHVTHAKERLPEQLPFHRHVPVPSFRIFERLALCRYHQRQCVAPIASWIIYRAEANTRVRLKRRTSSKEDGIAHPQSSEETAPAGAQHRILAKLIGESQSRLYLAPLNVRVMIGNTSVEETAVQGCAGLRHAADGG